MPIAFSNPTLEFPSGPLDAVTHPDPYPYYASLAARRPFGYDASLGLGVAAGPQALNNASGTIVTKGQAVINAGTWNNASGILAAQRGIIVTLPQKTVPLKSRKSGKILTV